MPGRLSPIGMIFPPQIGFSTWFLHFHRGKLGKTVENHKTTMHRIERGQNSVENPYAPYFSCGKC